MHVIGKLYVGVPWFINQLFRASDLGGRLSCVAKGMETSFPFILFILCLSVHRG